jgi:hypothetical protein
MKSKIAKVEITNIIDVESPTSKILIALVVANSLLDIMFARSIYVIHTLSINLVILLLTLYVLNCYKSGGCNTLALASSVLLIVLESLYLLLRLVIGEPIYMGP